MVGLVLGWARLPGVKGERKELEMEGADLEWKALKTKVRSRHTPTADIKICHALLCGNTRVLGERNVLGSIRCPDLFSTVLPPVTTSHVQQRRPTLQTKIEDRLPLLFLYHGAI